MGGFDDAWRTRAARPADAEAIAAIYNEGIAGRDATFETAPRSAADIVAWLAAGTPTVVVELSGEVVGWASATAYRPRAAYEGVREVAVYVRGDRRGRGVGRAALAAIAARCEEAGCWKLVSRVFPENVASRALLRAVGYREVGTYRRHGRLDGVWRDCVIVECLLGEAADPDAV